MFLRHCLAFATLLLATSGIAQTNLLLNPGFESGYTVNGQYGYFGYTGITTLITDWNYYDEGKPSYVLYQTGGTYYVSPLEGWANLRLNEGAGPSNGVYQDFTAAVGQTYTASVAAARNGPATLSLRLEVQTAAGTLVQGATTFISSNTYDLVSFNFVAPEEDLRFVISDWSTDLGFDNSSDLMVDSASVTAAAIPEPSTYAALAGAGALGLAALCRRKPQSHA